METADKFYQYCTTDRAVVRFIASQVGQRVTFDQLKAAVQTRFKIDPFIPSSPEAVYGLQDGTRSLVSIVAAPDGTIRR